MSNVDIGLIVSLVSVVIAAITAMVAMFTKLKKKFGELAKDGNWKKLYPMILRAMADAEATGRSGAEKKRNCYGSCGFFCEGIRYSMRG